MEISGWGPALGIRQKKSGMKKVASWAFSAIGWRCSFFSLKKKRWWSFFYYFSFLFLTVNNYIVIKFVCKDHKFVKWALSCTSNILILMLICIFFLSIHSVSEEISMAGQFISMTLPWHWPICSFNPLATSYVSVRANSCSALTIDSF